MENIRLIDANALIKRIEESIENLVYEYSYLDKDEIEEIRAIYEGMIDIVEAMPLIEETSIPIICKEYGGKKADYVHYDYDNIEEATEE